MVTFVVNSHAHTVYGQFLIMVDQGVQKHECNLKHRLDIKCG